MPRNENAADANGGARKSSANNSRSSQSNTRCDWEALINDGSEARKLGGHRCEACGTYAGERDYAAAWPFDSECDCWPVTPAAPPWPCYACGSQQHDRPAAGTGCGCNEAWFVEHEVSLLAEGSERESRWES